MLWTKAQHVEAFVTRSFKMNALSESCSAAGSAELAQSSVAECGGHWVHGEQRDLPPEGRHHFILVVRNVQNAVTFWTPFCSFLCLSTE